MGNVFSTNTTPTQTVKNNQEDTKIEPLSEHELIIPEKRIRKATVLQTFKSFIQPNSNPLIGIEVENENRSMTQYSSFINPRNDDGKGQLTKKKSFTKEEEDIFTILCVGAGGAGKSTVNNLNILK
jgi:hypothetical protein